MFSTNKNGRRHLAKELHERKFSFWSINTALKAHVDNNLANFNTRTYLNQYRFPWFSILTLPLGITGNMYNYIFPRVLPLDPSLLKLTLQACAINLSFQVSGRNYLSLTTKCFSVKNACIGHRLRSITFSCR